MSPAIGHLPVNVTPCAVRGAADVLRARLNDRLAVSRGIAWNATEGS